MTVLGRSRSILLLVGFGLLFSVGGAAAQGILDTKHNLSAQAGAGANRSAGNQELYLTAGTAEVCVFCHTPHGADVDVKAPMWNRAVTTATYTMYDSPTLDAKPSSTAANMGVSLACLSCHDGTVAFDALRNLPGSGGYQATPATTGRNPTGWTWNAGKKDMTGRGVTELGTNLNNTHPIAMIFNDARSPSSASQVETAGFQPASPPVNGRVFVERTVAVPGGTSITAKLPLYSPTGAVADARVQCGTCHDPHTKTTTFLRVDNTQSSALCRTCHLKDVN